MKSPSPKATRCRPQIAFGYTVDGYGVGDLLEYIGRITDGEVDSLVKEYFELYTVPDRSGAAMASIREAARQELGIRAFLETGGYSGFTTTFEDLHGLRQLPGLAAQRLMVDGYGFGAEGDWKTAALLHSMKVMASGLPGGVSFMEDYTYHFERGRERVLGSHMLEVCPSIAAGKPSLEVHPLGIGGKADPARLVFNTRPGPAVNASMIELGDRFRLVVNEVEVVAPDADLPKLPGSPERSGFRSRISPRGPGSGSKRRRPPLRSRSGADVRIHARLCAHVRRTVDRNLLKRKNSRRKHVVFLREFIMRFRLPWI